MAAKDLRASMRYASALFEAASADKIVDAVEQDLDRVLDLLRSTPLLRQMWDSPLVPASHKRDLLSRILADSISPLTLSFLRLLIDKRREEILEVVRDDVRRLADASRHVVRAEASFAVEPTEEERIGLISSLEQRTGEHVELAVSVDPGILGGVIVRMHDTIIDGSVRGTFERLREQLLQEA